MVRIVVMMIKKILDFILFSSIKDRNKTKHQSSFRLMLCLFYKREDFLLLLKRRRAPKIEIPARRT